jgi:hypothetical protein
VLALLACAPWPGASATASPAGELRVTLVGDSVAESLDYTPSARRILQRRFSLQLDLRACRRLVVRSCTFRGSTPPTALQAVEALGPQLGDVLVVDVGYNEGSAGYGRGIDQVMRAARAAGASCVVWVTLRESGSYGDVYRSTNAVIRRAAARWPQLVVADWNEHSDGRAWFAGDGLHLTPAGAEALARFLRRSVVEAGRS